MPDDAQPIRTAAPRADGRRPRLLYVVTEDWFFLSHRLPMARAAQATGFEVHVATNVADGAGAIAREGFVLHPVRFARGRLSPLATLATIRALRNLHRAIAPELVHHVALQATILGSLATLATAGTDAHLGGLFPMGAPQPYGTSRFGELNAAPSLHLVDGSVLPSIPAKFTTLTIMANADRIGRHLAGAA